MKAVVATQWKGSYGLLLVLILRNYKNMERLRSDVIHSFLPENPQFDKLAYPVS